MPIKEMNCTVCTKLYIGGIFPSRTTKFCSIECRNKSYIIPRDKKICLTCSNEFKILSSQRIGKFCSPKCIRYTGSIDKLRIAKNNGKWQKASEDEKLEFLKENFNKNVVKLDGCWKWLKRIFHTGYASVNIGKRKTILAHRASWIIHKGAIPDNLFVLHSCDNRSCTNPEHLFLGTQLDNVRDMDNKGRRVTRGMKK